MIEDKQWASPENRAIPPPQSTADQVDIAKQIIQPEIAGIIEESS